VPPTTLTEELLHKAVQSQCDPPHSSPLWWVTVDMPGSPELDTNKFWSSNICGTERYFVDKIDYSEGKNGAGKPKEIFTKYMNISHNTQINMKAQLKQSKHTWARVQKYIYRISEYCS